MTKRACASPNSNVGRSRESSGPWYSPEADRNFFGAAYPGSPNPGSHPWVVAPVSSGGSGTGNAWW
jgi:hypothetical protein